MATGSKIKNNLVIQGDVTASAFSGDGSGLTGVGTVTDVSYLATTASNSFISDQTVTGSVIATGDSSRVRFLASTLSDLPSATDNHGMFAHVHSTGLGYYAHAGNWIPLATSESVANIDVTIPSTYLTTTAYTTETITKNLNYDTSLNIAEITSSVEGAIIDYRLTSLDSGSRTGIFSYSHNGATLGYKDTIFTTSSIGDQPTLSATLTGSIVSIDIENAAGFNFSGFAKKFSKLDSAVNIILPPAPEVPLPLDSYGSALAAYSLRQISSTYEGNLIKVREDGSNTELDIGFDDDGNLDTGSIITHCGSNGGYVVTWYDQSGNTNNVTQTTGSLQPQIYDGSAITTATSGSVTANALKFIDNGDKLVFDTAPTYKTYAITYANAGRAQITSPNYSSARTGNSGIGYRFYSFEIGGGSANKVINGIDFTGVINDSTFNGWTGHSAVQANQELHTFVVNATKTPTAIGNQESSNNKISEVIFWGGTAKTSAEQIDISNIMNKYYNLYPEGLLYTHENSVAGYSIRQLSGNVTNCMDIRRASDNTEQTIGFISTGDLDTGSIETFCTGTECYVAKWYDQSGNGNHAEQTTEVNQPIIYSQSAVITSDGKPAPFSDSTDRRLNIPSTTWQDVAYTIKYSGSSNTSYNSAWGGSGIPNGSGFSVRGGDLNRGIYTYYDASNENYHNNNTSATAQHGTYTPALNVQGFYFLNGASTHTGTLNLFGRNTSDNGMEGYIFEFIAWNTDKSSSRLDIASNTNDYFNIY